MSSSKDRILEAAVRLIEVGTDAGTLTVRQIADEAGVAVGAINYHFQSKDNLLIQAVGQLVGAEANRWLDPAPDAEPLERLRQIFKQTARVTAAYGTAGNLLVRQALLEGDFTSQRLILPLLREILGPDRPEAELRLLAFQLITPMQDAFVRPEAFAAYSGIDIFDEAQRDAAIDMLIDNLLGEH
ncbi:MAG: TetR/AcrR family transcriptional regulator [Anaerolineae bacterium]